MRSLCMSDALPHSLYMPLTCSPVRRKREDEWGRSRANNSYERFTMSQSTLSVRSIITGCWQRNRLHQNHQIISRGTLLWRLLRTTSRTTSNFRHWFQLLEHFGESVAIDERQIAAIQHMSTIKMTSPRLSTASMHFITNLGTVTFSRLHKMSRWHPNISSESNGQNIS